MSHLVPGPRRDYDQRFGQNYQPSGSRYDNRAPQYYGPPSPRDQRMVNNNSGNQSRYGPPHATQWSNGSLSGNGSQWDQSRSQSLSPRMGRRQRSCWICGQVGCHSRSHPPEEQAPNQQQQFRQPSAPQQRQGSPPNNNAQTTIAYFLDDNDVNNAPCMLNLPISVLPEWKSPRVNMKIEGETLPVLLDTGAEISAMPKKIMENFVDCSTLNTHRRCQTFGGYVLTTLLPECRSMWLQA